VSTTPDGSSLLVLSAGDRICGNPEAAVTLIQYGCYACPASAILHAMVPELQRQFPTQLCVVFRHFPVPDPTGQALHAAEAAEAAGVQGQFWQMHDYLFSHQDALGDGDLATYAIALQLNVEQFLREIRQDIYVDRVKSDIVSGLQLGVAQAPGVFINGQRYTAALEFDAVCMAIEQALQDRSPSF
jgi:protein-disulfide isomerase